MKISEVGTSSSATDGMSPLSRNISTLLELPLEEQGTPHIIAESLGKVTLHAIIDI